MKKVKVCLSSELSHLFDFNGKVVVIIDILRASSCITTGLASGIAHIKPVATLEECLTFKEKDYYLAAERNGKKVDGFDIGNSPYSYMESRFVGKKIAATTTNGTSAILKSINAEEVIVASFLNLSSIANYLLQGEHDCILHCAGWKGNYSLEDTLFAGALVEKLQPNFSFDDDATFSAFSMYDLAKVDLLTAILSSSHAKRLEKYAIRKDIEFCCGIDKYDVLPTLNNGVLVKK